MLTRRRITVALAMLTVQRSAEAAERHLLRPQRARVLPAGALIVDAILERYACRTAPRVATRGSGRGWLSRPRPPASEWRDRLSTLVVGWPERRPDRDLIGRRQRAPGGLESGDEPPDARRKPRLETPRHAGPTVRRSRASSRSRSTR